MGLLKAGVGALSGVLADQWREYIYCDSLSTDVLVQKGKKRITDRGSNTKGTDNIITNGSIVAVNEGQCMLIVDQGKIAEVCAEAGEFVYDSSTEPSIFYGGLGKGLLDSFKAIGKRFSFGGDAPKDQRVYFVNIKEILGNKFGTAQPIPVRVIDANIGLDMDISVRCNGEYSYKIVNPILFYTNVCGNVTDTYTRSQIDSMLKAEFLDKLQPALFTVSEMGIRYSAFPGKTKEIRAAINSELAGDWEERRGIVVDSIAFNSVTAPKEDEDRIKRLQETAVMRNPNMAAATLVSAQSDAMRAAAANENGAMMGFMGMGMAAQVGGANPASLFAMGMQNGMQQGQPMQNMQQMQQMQYAQQAQGANVTGNVNATGWTCSCGALNKGRFCSECGTKKPEGELLYRCDKCGWEPDDPKKPPKFCPQCGDPFNDLDSYTK